MVNIPMPVSPRQNQANVHQLSEHSLVDPGRLRPYRHWGVDLSVVPGGGSHAVGRCPFCGRDGKFSVDVQTGLWRCFTCGAGTEAGGGNALVFLRILHERSLESIYQRDFAGDVAADRRLCDPETVLTWGVCRSPIPPHPWIVPGYGAGGKLDQLYRRAWISDSSGEYSWRLLPTPGVWPEGKVHALHLPARDFDPARPKVDVLEGPWDGAAFWEVARPTDSNVVAVPGCNVWRDEWTALCMGKHVTLWFDSDHPREFAGRTSRAGYDGVRRVARRIAGVAASVHWLRWGPDGYDPARPSGWDVRDHLSRTGAPGGDRVMPMSGRRALLDDLLAKVEGTSADWSLSTLPSSGGGGGGGGGGARRVGSRTAEVESQDCHTWAACEGAWREAMHWRQDMSDALAVLLAVCASTRQAGNQLFLDLVGSAGSGKTTLCEGLLVSNHCHHLEHLTGFHSGWRKEGDNDKDCSLIARINGKTLVTPEFDVMRSSPRYAELMGQQRRIFDGKSGATYKNSDEDTLYVGLRTPWIRAGTQAIMDWDQAQLGDRFMRVIIGDPSEDEKRAIMRSALKSERVAMLETSNGTAGSVVEPRMRRAHALTGGYVDWLREHVEERLAAVAVDDDAEECCVDLAELSADLRARPQEDKRVKENHDCKELPTRLARQNIRLASCLAVVLCKRSIDAEVLRIVRKVALDTAHGYSQSIARWLCSPNPRAPGGRTYQAGGGLSASVLEVWLGMTEERVLKYLLFLRKIGVAEMRTSRCGAQTWLLSDRAHDLYIRVMAR